MAEGVQAVKTGYQVEHWEAHGGGMLRYPARGMVIPYDDNDAAVTGYWYVPDPGFTGSDTFALHYSVDGVTHVENVNVLVGGDVSEVADAAGGPTDGVVNAVALTGDELSSALWQWQIDQDLNGETPAEPEAPSEDDGDHTVPGTVETGGEAAWLLAGAGALIATALVAARRRLGLGS